MVLTYNVFEPIQFNERIILKEIIFKPDNPYSKYFSHGKVDYRNGAIGFYQGNKFHHVERYSRYLMSVKKGRLLSMAECDSILRDSNTHLDLTPIVVKPKESIWKKIVSFFRQLKS